MAKSQRPVVMDKLSSSERRWVGPPSLAGQQPRGGLTACRPTAGGHLACAMRGLRPPLPHVRGAIAIF
jgi:hypothetical protein